MILKKIVLIALVLCGGLGLKAQETAKKFKVYGNCGMCESRIEKAAMSVDGVSFADWDKVTKMINVKFDKSKTDAHKIQMVIANSGHDTEMHKAKDEVYNKLPGCCHYERSPKKHMGHKH
jgi:copper chaperone CopZ